MTSMETTSGPSTSVKTDGLSGITWPPQTLTVNVNEIIDECELKEMMSAGLTEEAKQQIPVVEMAALLYQGELIHARHLWRRSNNSSGNGCSNPSTMLEDWWNVTKAMIQNDGLMIWKSLQKIIQDHPQPFKNYAQEVGNVYRIRLLSLHQPGQSATSSIYWSLLNFNNEEECKDFSATFQPQIKSYSGRLASFDDIALTSIVSCLESASKKGRI